MFSLWLFYGHFCSYVFSIHALLRTIDSSFVFTLSVSSIQEVKKRMRFYAFSKSLFENLQVPLQSDNDMTYRTATETEAIIAQKVHR